MARKRILIAEENDQDAQILSNVLHRLGRCEVHRVRSALEALRITRGEVFDLVLMNPHFSDGSDGIGAIRAMRLRRRGRPPQIVMVSSQSDEGTVRRSIAAGAVDFLVKPLDLHRLLECFEHLWVDQERSTHTKAIEQRIREILNTLTDLPTLPEILVRVEQLSEDPHASAEDLSEVIELDQAITAKLLRVTNSAFYSFVRTITSVQEAVVLLGFGIVKGIVMALTAVDVLDTIPGGGGVDRRRLWEHSAACGVMAHRIDAQLGMEHSTSFTAGVLHDMGKVVLDGFFPEYFTAVLQRMDQDRLLMVEAEQEVLGLTHADIGMYLGERWCLPPDLVEAIGGHHQVTASKGDPRLSALIHVADVVCHRCEQGEKKAPDMDPAALEVLGLTEELIEGEMVQARKEIERAKRILIES